MYLIPKDHEVISTVRQVLQTWHRGRDKAIKMRDLLREIFGSDANQSESYNNTQMRQIRDAIEKINQEGGLICSLSSIGYWWADNFSDGMACVNEKRGRVKTIRENADTLEKNLLNEYSGQMRLV